MQFCYLFSSLNLFYIYLLSGFKYYHVWELFSTFLSCATNASFAPQLDCLFATKSYQMRKNLCNVKGHMKGCITRSWNRTYFAVFITHLLFIFTARFLITHRSLGFADWSRLKLVGRNASVKGRWRDFRGLGGAVAHLITRISRRQT